MKWLIASVAGMSSLLAFALPAGATSILYAQGPASASAGEEISIDIRLLISDAVNALSTTVHVEPASAVIGGFDDSGSVIRLWLQKGIPVEGGIALEGVIPGGISPAFTASLSLGILKIRPTTQDAVHITFSDSQVYLHLPLATLDTVKVEPLTIAVHGRVSGILPRPLSAVVVDADVRIVKDSALFEGRRTLLYDIKTDQGTADSIRIRERWLGIFGSWRDGTNPSTLSDSLGVSILDVRLPESQGGAHVTSVIPGTLIALWALLCAVALIAGRRWYMKRN